MAKLAVLVMAVGVVGCIETSSRTAGVESCDTWTVDDPIMLWPPDHSMRPYSLDDCVTIVPHECPPPPTGCCGDGVVDPGEQCDDGNDNPVDGCHECILDDDGEDLLPGPAIVMCPTTGCCGNRIVDAGEQCDDGNIEAADGCDRCILDDDGEDLLPGPPIVQCETYCGDGVLDPGEQCDDGNGNPFDGCDRCIIVDTNPDKSTPGQSSATGLSITSITSDEADDGSGDGHTTGDTVVVDATTFQLRAERSGNGDGRTYSVSFVDANGATGTCTFFVPHDRSAH